MTLTARDGSVISELVDSWQWFSSSRMVVHTVTGGVLLLGNSSVVYVGKPDGYLWFENSRCRRPNPP